MAGQKKVIDASIGVKWFTQEEGSQKARELLRQHIKKELILVVPDLFFYEVYNAVRYKNNPVEYLSLCINALYSFQLECVHISSEIASEAGAIAVEKKLSFYDAVYLSLAVHANTTCITCDTKMLDSGGSMTQSLDS